MSFRIETDSMGEIKVGATHYWGAQTQRAIEHFKIGSEHFDPSLISAFGSVKKAAALTNKSFGRLPDAKCDLIVRACDEVIAGKWDDHFPLVIWQTGSGTQTNMNANEVISNRANEMAGSGLGKKSPIHPNDDVNLSQSSNDVFPTCMHVAAVNLIDSRLLPPLQALRKTFETHSQKFATTLKIGRTHMMDATPLTLGQEFSGYAAQLAFAEKQLKAAVDGLYDIALGGTAVGTGMNTPHGYGEKVAETLSKITSKPFRSAPNKFMALAAHDGVVAVSGTLRLLASALFKIGNDIRLMASGPRCGLGELTLPANEPGSSIMPGKVNPTQVEALTMVCCQVIGNDAAIAMAGSGGQLELNTYKPVMIYNLLQSIKLLGDACTSFNEHCLTGLEANSETLTKHVNNSLMLVTALAPALGYDGAAKIAQLALKDNLSLRDAALKSGLIKAEEYDRTVKPMEMTRPNS